MPVTQIPQQEGHRAAEPRHFICIPASRTVKRLCKRASFVHVAQCIFTQL